MRILLLNQTFYPDVAATAQLGYDLAQHLTQQGHEVTVIASRSLYGQAGAALPRRETVDGINIRRVGVSLFGKRSIFLRLIDFALFYLLAGWAALRLPKQDVAICFTTPPMIATVGLMLRKLRGTRVVYWVMDLYPDVLTAAGVLRENSLPARTLTAINNHCVRKADRTVVLGRCMQQRLIDKGLPAEKIECIRVWSDTSELATADDASNTYRQQWGLDGKFVVMYSGNFGLGHDLESLCEAAQLLRDREDIAFAFVGGGKRKAFVEQYVAEHNLTNAQCHPYQPREKLGELLSAADVHLASQLVKMSGVLVPSKAFGIMAAGRPTIMLGPDTGEIALLLRQHDAGIVLQPGDSEGLAGAIASLADDRTRARAMGQRARHAMQAHYDRRHACTAWAELLSRVVT